MKTSEKGINFIKSFEAFKERPYLCPAGVWTIGYGHVIGQNEHFDEISENYAHSMLAYDLKFAESAVSRNIDIELSQNEFDALVSFAFNLGSGALQRSTLRQKINYGIAGEDIYKEFMKWVYAAGRKLVGLVRRRSAEAEMYLL